MKNLKSFSNRKSGGIVLGFKEEYDSFIHPIPKKIYIIIIVINIDEIRVFRCSSITIPI
jgi:hypothetical protein